MKFIKKITAVCLVLALVTANFSGCKKKDNSGDSQTDPVTTVDENSISQAVDPNDTRPMIAIITSNNPMQKVEAQYASYAVDLSGYRPEIMVHNGNTDEEAALFESAIEKKAVAILCDVQSSIVSAEAIKNAKVNNIPTFTMNNSLMEEGVAINQFLTNNYDTTKQAAIKYVDKAGQLGKFSIIFGADDTNTSDIRLAAFTEVLVQYQGLEMVGYDAIHNANTEHEDSIKALLTANSDLKGLLCVTEEITLSALKVKKDMGLNDLVIVGFGGSNEIKDAIISGELTAAILPHVTMMGEMAAERAASFLEKRSQEYEELQTISSILITSDNVNGLDNYVYTD